ncbi:hypothetical protein Q3G72_019936 [Acer saccharum]|nr:hypothetical protein Q3G72_019936 [Acer saccharum]
MKEKEREKARESRSDSLGREGNQVKSNGWCSSRRRDFRENLFSVFVDNLSPKVERSFVSYSRQALFNTEGETRKGGGGVWNPGPGLVFKEDLDRQGGNFVDSVHPSQRSFAEVVKRNLSHKVPSIKTEACFNMSWKIKPITNILFDPVAISSSFINQMQHRVSFNLKVSSFGLQGVKVGLVAPDITERSNNGSNQVFRNLKN